MADPLTYTTLLENSHLIELSLAEEELDDDEKKELTNIWNSLKSRQESKFDAIISLIKECDRQIKTLDREIKDLKNNKTHWENKRKCIINIIKAAYEKDLIDSKPTGERYQATIKTVKSKLVTNYEYWTNNEKKDFSLHKKTTVTELKTNKLVSNCEEDLPNKEKLQKILETQPKKAPTSAHLIRRVSLTYGLRKRIKRGI